MVTESATTNEQLTFSNGNGMTIASKESTMSVSAHGGQPKGSTIAASKDFEERVEKCKQEAAKNYDFVRNKYKTMNKRVPWGSLTMIIDGAKRKFDLPTSTIIQKNSIRERVKRSNFRLIQQPGHTLPLLEIEPYILHLIDQLAKMRAPLNVLSLIHI